MDSNFNNTNIPLGKLGNIEVANEVMISTTKEITTSDIVNYMRKSNSLGRLVTKISLAINGKGWISTKKIETLINSGNQIGIERLKKDLIDLKKYIQNKYADKNKLSEERIRKIDSLLETIWDNFLD